MFNFRFYYFSVQRVRHDNGDPQKSRRLHQEKSRIEYASRSQGSDPYMNKKETSLGVNIFDHPTSC